MRWSAEISLKMGFQNGTNTTATAEEGYAMEVIFRDHRPVMAVICSSSLALGLPLAINMLSHLKVLAKQSTYCANLPPPCYVRLMHICTHNAFQVATDAKGRGVLRLLLLQQQINILEVPVICAQLALLAFPEWRAPVAFCTVFDIITRFTLMVRYMSNFAIALGR